MTGSEVALGQVPSISKIVKLARTPILHFVLMGLGLFWLTHPRDDAREPASYRFVITHGHVNSLVAKFQRTWNRSPQPSELRGLVEDLVQEEIFVREALALDLDRDDPLIRRRLRQKFEELTVGNMAEAEPTDAELQAFLESHSRLTARSPEGPGASSAPASGQLVGDPQFQAIRDMVRNEWFAAARTKALDEQYAELRSRYKITVQRPRQGR